MNEGGADAALGRFDELLPEEVRELPEDLASLDELLADPALPAPIEGHWQAEAEQRGQSVSRHGRPTIPMATESGLRLWPPGTRLGANETRPGP